LNTNGSQQRPPRMSVLSKLNLLGLILLTEIAVMLRLAQIDIDEALIRCQQAI